MFFFLWVSFLIEKPWILRVFRKAPFYLEVFIEYLIFFFGLQFLYQAKLFTLLLLFWKCSTKNFVLNIQLLCLLVLLFRLLWKFTHGFYLSSVLLPSTAHPSQISYSENIFLPYPFSLNCAKDVSAWLFYGCNTLSIRCYFLFFFSIETSPSPLIGCKWFHFLLNFDFSLNFTFQHDFFLFSVIQFIYISLIILLQITLANHL